MPGPPTFTARELFDRSLATLVRSWTYFASGSAGAEVIELEGAVVATFVRPPESEFLNNTVLRRGVADLAATLEAVERVYAERGIARFAVWVHESEAATAAELEARGYGYDSSTRTMAMPIAAFAAPEAIELELVEPDLTDFHRAVGMPPGLFAELDPAGAEVYLARFEGADAASLLAFDHGGDCGIYNLATVPSARRRGLGTALTAHAVAAARERGCATASLQSTAMAEALYASLGFRDLGRFDEYVARED